MCHDFDIFDLLFETGADLCWCKQLFTAKLWELYASRKVILK